MSSLYWMVTISDRNFHRRLLAFYKEHGVTVALLALGRGTAASEVLDAFGLEASEKAVQFAMVTDQEWKSIKSGLEKQIKIDIPGTGIAFVIPVSSVGGKRQFLFLTEGRSFEKGEESSLKDTKYELLVAVANQGYTEQIMDAARQEKAGGGTVIHARGTGMQKAEHFLGVSLAREKEIVFLVTRREDKNAIMRAIMEKAGIGTKAGAIVFSLPVTETAGMRLLEDEEEKEQ
ncbi:MAG: P-II family nitrogen regulator [Eubacteriales bacterium]|nr:P-II family nitrogen regulator [Eubacteriales bacterium]